MRFGPHILEEIKARLPVSAIVGRRVKLVKAGREWKGLSPFNAERTPSFFVNDQKQRFFDFSSGKNGNIFDFVMETEGLSFPEAVERLAAEAGVALPTSEPADRAREEERLSLIDAMELAAAFFEARLRDKGGAEARAYLKGRDLQPAVQDQFRIGYAPAERFALRDHLAGKGVSAEAMIAAGLLVHGEEIPVPYDRFRDRIMFPIQDARGRVIAFGGRAMKADAPAKYLNSPETPLFHKGATLYNLHAARKAAREAGAVIAVEGYVDVIAMTRAGFPNTVAPLGTALTEDQLALLWRMAPEPVLLFDGDKAGRRAAQRAIDVALPLIGPGRTLRFAFMAGGKDPDELLRSAGAEALRAVVERTAPLVDVLFAREREAAPLDTPERRVDLRRRLIEAARQIQDEPLRLAYRDDLLGRLKALEPAAGTGRRGDARPAGERPRGRGRDEREGRAAPMAPTQSLLGSPLMQAGGGAMPRREVAILHCAMTHPALIERDVEAFVALPLAHPALARLRAAMVDALCDMPRIDPETPFLDAPFADAPPGPATLRDRLAAGEAGGVVRAVEAALGVAEWWARADAPVEAAARAFDEAVALHLRASALSIEVRVAEEECLNAPSEAAYERLKEAVRRLTLVDDAEGTADPFGARRA